MTHETGATSGLAPLSCVCRPGKAQLRRYPYGLLRPAHWAERPSVACCRIKFTVQRASFRLVPECETFHGLPVLQLRALIWDRNQIYFCADHELTNIFKSKDDIFKTNLFLATSIYFYLVLILLTHSEMLIFFSPTLWCHKRADNWWIPLSHFN